MKNKSAFSQIMILVIVLLVCIILTVGIALLVGSYNATIFDFRNLNFANMIPVLVIGGFVTCVAVGITVLFVSRALFFKVKDFLLKETNEKGEEE